MSYMPSGQLKDAVPDAAVPVTLRMATGVAAAVGAHVSVRDSIRV